MTTSNMADIVGVVCAVEGFERGLVLLQSEVYLWSLCNSLEGVVHITPDMRYFKSDLNRIKVGTDA